MPFVNEPVKDEIVKILNSLSELQCKILFGESEKFRKWLNENKVKDKVRRII